MFPFSLLWFIDETYLICMRITLNKYGVEYTVFTHIFHATRANKSKYKIFLISALCKNIAKQVLRLCW
jgi:hypothetical protein